MPQRNNQVRLEPIAKQDVSAALAEGWARVSRKHGKGSFADAMKVDAKLINRALTGETVPELHTAFNSLRADPTALQEVADLYDVEIRPKRTLAANDHETVAGISHLVGQWIQALADGHRDHRETCVLAEAIRDLLPRLSGIVAEADRIKGVAA